MGFTADKFRVLAKELNKEYKKSSVFGEWVSHSNTDRDPSLDYYQGGRIVAEMSNNFLTPITATRLSDTLVDTEKIHIIEEIRNTAEEGIIEVNALPEYSQKGLTQAFGNVNNPSTLILPAKKGRPK